MHTYNICIHEIQAIQIQISLSSTATLSSDAVVSGCVVVLWLSSFTNCPDTLATIRSLQMTQLFWNQTKLFYVNFFPILLPQWLLFNLWTEAISTCFLLWFTPQLLINSSKERNRGIYIYLSINNFYKFAPFFLYLFNENLNRFQIFHIFHLNPKCVYMYSYWEICK